LLENGDVLDGQPDPTRPAATTTIEASTVRIGGTLPPNWSLLSSRGQVLLYVAQRPDSTLREIANALELTERRVLDVLQELVEDRLITKIRCGRKNSYEVNVGAKFRVGALGYLRVQGLLEAFARS
jgi:hypothetical protein